MEIWAEKLRLAISDDVGELRANKVCETLVDLQELLKERGYAIDFNRKMYPEEWQKMQSLVEKDSVISSSFHGRKILLKCGMIRLAELNSSEKETAISVQNNVWKDISPEEVENEFVNWAIEVQGYAPATAKSYRSKIRRVNRYVKEHNIQINVYSPEVVPKCNLIIEHIKKYATDIYPKSEYFIALRTFQIFLEYAYIDTGNVGECVDELGTTEEKPADNSQEEHIEIDQEMSLESELEEAKTNNRWLVTSLFEIVMRYPSLGLYIDQIMDHVSSQECTQEEVEEALQESPWCEERKGRYYYVSGYYPIC